MSVNPLQREGGYWKPVLDYEHWDDKAPESGSAAGTVSAAAQEQVRYDLCHRCGAEFVVDSPYCRMCGRARDDSPRPEKSRWQLLDFHELRRSLGLSLGAMIGFIVGLVCIGAAIATGFIYTANTLVDWQAIQAWRAEWLIAAGVAFLCGILLNSRRTTHN